MDFLDSLDLDTKDKKSHRVRSWYLYEQYKSLENHQLNAAQKLKDKAFQDRILRQELTERRARRKLYDQFGLCQSESRLQKSIKTDSIEHKTLSVSNDEFFESFSEQEDERVTQETDFDDYSQDLSTSKCYMDDFKSTGEQKESVSYPESVNSVVENVIPNDCECDNYEYAKDTQFKTIIIAQDINQQLDTVKQDIQSLENITKLQDFDKLSDNVSLGMTDSCETMKKSRNSKTEKEYNNVVAIWSRLVSFAYQIVHLNHGNCYCDYSSQFLTAVLACDVLRRGVNRMCNILQPYVSPIKFATDESEVSDCCCMKIKKSAQLRKSRKIFVNKLLRRGKQMDKSRHAHRNYSENWWQHRRRRCAQENKAKSKQPRRDSEPWRGVNPSYSSSSSLWSHISKENMSKSTCRGCSCFKRAVNPMLEIARYIDAILKDMDDSYVHV